MISQDTDRGKRVQSADTTLQTSTNSAAQHQTPACIDSETGLLPFPQHLSQLTTEKMLGLLLRFVGESLEESIQSAKTGSAQTIEDRVVLKGLQKVLRNWHNGGSQQVLRDRGILIHEDASRIFVTIPWRGKENRELLAEEIRENVPSPEPKNWYSKLLAKFFPAGSRVRIVQEEKRGLPVETSPALKDFCRAITDAGGVPVVKVVACNNSGRSDSEQVVILARLA